MANFACDFPFSAPGSLIGSRLRSRLSRHTELPAGIAIAALLLVAQLAAGWFTTLSAQAQGFGLEPITRAEFDSIPRWKPDPEGVGEIPSMDLRPWLPPVLMQYGSSCTGCAAAYGCKSFIEARDRAWSPLPKSHQFSPAFVYNQLNGGIDRGAKMLPVLELMVNSGCATLVTMPYDADYKKKPTAAASQEAAKFKCHKYYTLTTGPQIRKALQQGHVVIIAVMTDPVFNSGRHAQGIFTESMRQEALSRRSPDDPHGYHALLVVGYDDMRQAFLLMNSWGKNWGQQGYCWVHYDLLRNVTPQSGNFCDAAFVLTNPPTSPTVGAEAPLTATGSAHYAGYLNGTHNWLWTVKLDASPESARKIAKVTWSAVGRAGKSQDFLATSADDGFAARGQELGAGALSLTGKVGFNDGTTKTVTTSIPLAPPVGQKRSLELVESDHYMGRVQGIPYWEWTVQLRGSVTDLSDVAQVTYHLHQTFPDPDRVVTTSPLNGFAFTTNGWGGFPLRATVSFKDGSKSEYSLRFKFHDSIKDELGLYNLAVPTGVRGGEQYYDWTAYLAGPLMDLKRIRFVRYHLHSTFVPNQFDVAGGVEHGFPFSASGWGVFNLRATVVFQDGSTRELSHMLNFQETRRVD